MRTEFHQATPTQLNESKHTNTHAKKKKKNPLLTLRAAAFQPEKLCFYLCYWSKYLA